MNHVICASFLSVVVVVELLSVDVADVSDARLLICPVDAGVAAFTIAKCPIPN